MSCHPVAQSPSSKPPVFIPRHHPKPPTILQVALQALPPTATVQDLYDKLISLSPIPDAVEPIFDRWLRTENIFRTCHPKITIIDTMEIRLSFAQCFTTLEIPGLRCFPPFSRALTSLTLSRTLLSDISRIGEMTSLEHFCLIRSQVSDFSSLQHCTRLQSLTITFSSVTDLSFLSALVNLSELQLAHNPIQDISVLANLTCLHTLSLSSCNVTNISALSNCRHLKDLDLSDNKITDIHPLAPCKHLVFLDLHGNPNLVDISIITRPNFPGLDQGVLVLTGHESCFLTTGEAITWFQALIRKREQKQHSKIALSL